MRKIYGLMLTAILSLVLSSSHAQFFNCSPLKFSGAAPSPWAIDGQIADWETILGAVNASDPIFPFGPSIGQNGSYDTYGLNDPDNPELQSDLRVLSTIHDDYNVFFYFRRLNNINSPNKAFYFLDINIDGYVNTGEPVIAIYFNGQRVHKLAICRYIASNPLGDPDNGNAPVGTCIIDGTTMPGTIEELFKSNNAELLPNEIFAAEVTEDGYGVELALPWRFISQYKLFAYHLALQKGAGTYNPNATADDASGCDIGRLDIVGGPDVEVQNINIVTVTPGLSFRIDITFANLTPAILKVFTTDLVVFKNIVQRDGLPIDETQFSVIINGSPYNYFDGTFANQPIRYSSVSTPGAGQFYLQPFETKTISISIGLPPNHSVLSTEIELNPKTRFFLEDDCSPNTGGGGKPTNPIGFTVGDETATKNHNNISLQREVDRSEKVTLYPNPSKGSATLLLPAGEKWFDIYMSDYMGRVIRAWNHVNPGNLKFEVPNKGFYILKIRTASGKQTIKKLIVQ
jgi:hypothetical protein